MKCVCQSCGYRWNMSPSMRREWIEILELDVALFEHLRLPPCGGSGLKYKRNLRNMKKRTSPSMRREWIEIPVSAAMSTAWNTSPSMRREWIEISHSTPIAIFKHRLPPCGGSGLKFETKYIIVNVFRLPPCGGSGLKCYGFGDDAEIAGSPSMRREWIEISVYQHLCI